MLAENDESGFAENYPRELTAPLRTADVPGFAAAVEMGRAEPFETAVALALSPPGGT